MGKTSSKQKYDQLMQWIPTLKMQKRNRYKVLSIKTYKSGK